MRAGILADPFDPVTSAHIDACRDALSSGLADQILLVLSASGSCRAEEDDRWRMLCAAASCSKQLVPLRRPLKADPRSPEKLLRYIRKKFPETDPFFLPDVSPQHGLCPSVDTLWSSLNSLPAAS